MLILKKQEEKYWVLLCLKYTGQEQSGSACAEYDHLGHWIHYISNFDEYRYAGRKHTAGYGDHDYHLPDRRKSDTGEKLTAQNSVRFKANLAVFIYVEALTHKVAFDVVLKVC